MTTVFGLVDSDTDRREKTVNRVIDKLNGLDCLQCKWQRFNQGELVMLLHATDSVPFSHAASQPRWTVVCGNFVEDEVTQSPAEIIDSSFVEPADLSTFCRNGLYLACSRDIAGNVIISTDSLGFFPLYYWATPTLLVFSSSPDLIRLHSDYNGELSPEGLAGIMLFGYMAGEQSLWEGICRPLVGEVLIWRPGKGATTRVANKISASENYYHLTYENARQFASEALHEAVRRSISRHDAQLSMMLSGGLDSRLLAGYVAKERPGGVTALTFGMAKDMEATCANRVAGELAMPVLQIQEDQKAFTEAALECQARENLSVSLWDFSWVSAVDNIPSRPIVSGLHGDPILGGTFNDYAWDQKRGINSFDCLFRRFNSWGFSATEILRLVSFTDMKSPLNTVLEKLREQYEKLPGHPFQKNLIWGLNYRNRFHVNPAGFRLSSHGWPVMPYIDRRLLDLALGLPMNYLNRRRIQIDTLKKEFPKLAKLPLDRNSYNQTPLIPTIRWRIRNKLMSPIQRSKNGGIERRTYYRQFDINNEGWLQIRRAAEKSRPLARHLFHAEQFDSFIPPPNQPISTNDGITDSAKHKLLINILLYLGSNN